MTEATEKKRQMVGSPSLTVLGFRPCWRWRGWRVWNLSGRSRDQARGMSGRWRSHCGEFGVLTEIHGGEGRGGARGNRSRAFCNGKVAANSSYVSYVSTAVLCV